MKKDMDNLHSGHRNRLREKFLKDPSSFNDHEILEMVLFSVFPRQDTNELAHKLLRCFGTLYKVFSASANELMAVSGVGEKCASAILLYKELVERVAERSQYKANTFRYSFDNFKNELIEYYDGMFQERFLLVLLDKNYCKLTTITFEDKNRDSVSADIPEIAKAFAINKPIYAMAAHNHPSGILKPSEADDLTTAKLNLLSGIHGVTLLDHIIISKDKAYSYHQAGRLEYIKNHYGINKVLKDIQENNNG